MNVVKNTKLEKSTAHIFRVVRVFRGKRVLV